jgi:hypothetical protein
VNGDSPSRGEPRAAEVPAQEIYRARAGEDFGRAAALDDCFVAAAAHDHFGPRAEERVARDALAALDRFEQEGVGLFAGHAQERAERRLQVREHDAHDRHDVAARRLALELFEGCWLEGEHKNNEERGTRNDEPET